MAVLMPTPMINGKLHDCPACHSKDVSSTFQGVAMRFVTCDICGVRGPVEGDANAAERGWNAMPRDPRPMTLGESIGVLNSHRHMASTDWHEHNRYDEPVASNGLSALTEFEARAIAMEYKRAERAEAMKAEADRVKAWEKRDMALRLSAHYRNHVFKVYRSPHDVWVCGDCSPCLEEIEGAEIECIASCKNGRVVFSRLGGEQEK